MTTTEAARTYQNARTDALVTGLAAWMLDAKRNPEFWQARFTAVRNAK